jgi:hypothetical protein
VVRATFLLLFLALTGCGDDPAPRAKAKAARDARTALPTRPAPEPPSAEEEAASADAADVLRAYYALIGRGDYAGAARLRSQDDTDVERFADNFRAYERYEVQLGAPTRPVRAGGFLFVDVPVMITGAFKGGKSFGSVGRVTMRRPAEPAGGEAGWRVYTG